MAQGPILAGQRLTVGVLSGAFAGGVIANHVRLGTAKALTTTEAGVCRLDALQLYANRSYQIIATGLRIAGVNSANVPSHYAWRLRYNSAGVATTSSNEIGRSEITITSTTPGAFDNAAPAIGYVDPLVDTAVGSIILTCFRTAGTVNGDAIQFDTGGLWLRVLDLGYAVADSGTDI